MDTTTNPAPATRATVPASAQRLALRMAERLAPHYGQEAARLSVLDDLADLYGYLAAYHFQVDQGWV